MSVLHLYISVIGYSRFVAFNPDCAVHTAIADVVSYQSLMCIAA